MAKAQDYARRIYSRMRSLTQNTTKVNPTVVVVSSQGVVGLVPLHDSAMLMMVPPVLMDKVRGVCVCVCVCVLCIVLCGCIAWCKSSFFFLFIHTPTRNSSAT